MTTLDQYPTDIKRVLILGAECTGKTTLAQDLAVRFATHYVPEYMRTYLEHKPSGYVCQYQDLLPIAIGQMCDENTSLQKANRYLFCDTSLFEIMAYAFWYFGRCPDEMVEAVGRHHYDLVLLTDEKHIVWQADGMRDLPHGRHQMRQHLMMMLSKVGWQFDEVSGTRQERVSQVQKLISQIT